MGIGLSFSRLRFFRWTCASENTCTGALGCSRGFWFHVLVPDSDKVVCVDMCSFEAPGVLVHVVNGQSFGDKKAEHAEIEIKRRSRCDARRRRPCLGRIGTTSRDNRSYLRLLPPIVASNILQDGRSRLCYPLLGVRSRPSAWCQVSSSNLVGMSSPFAVSFSARCEDLQPVTVSHESHEGPGPFKST